LLIDWLGDFWLLLRYARAWGFQFGHPLDQTGQQAAVLPQLLGSDVQLLAEVGHLILQGLD
jgi:hypothetical protein